MLERAKYLAFAFLSLALAIASPEIKSMFLDVGSLPTLAIKLISYAFFILFLYSILKVVFGDD